jgi:hypothetical protein
MTIMYNKNTPDYYLVAGLNDKDPHSRTYGYKTRNLSGDFIIISSDHQVNGRETTGYGKTVKLLKKTFLILLLISIIPFSSAIATGYIHLLINAESVS